MFGQLVGLLFSLYILQEKKNMILLNTKYALGNLT